ncbi:MAG: DUF1311 domain-containing protein [Acetatifactor sp.]|nr:DUF1311 domain-containing protein [Acetatifactor sp.]
MNRFLMIVVSSLMVVALSACGKTDGDGAVEITPQPIETVEKPNDAEDKGTGGNGSTSMQGVVTQPETTHNETEEFDLAAELEEVEKQAARLEQKLQDAISQADMNGAAEEIFELWDSELNVIWGRLKEVLSEEEMAKLTAEEREWIAHKESEAEAAGTQYEGGSMTALIVAQKKAELTRERVYELAGQLGERIGQTVSVPKTDDYTGFYADMQGTSDVYSELVLTYLGDGIYEATIGLYRLTTLEGKARVDGEVLSFEDEDFKVKGEIYIQDEGVVFTATESEFIYIKPGDVFEFPEKLY